MRGALAAVAALVACARTTAPEPTAEPHDAMAPGDVTRESGRPEEVRADRVLVERLASDALEGRRAGSEGGKEARRAIVEALTACGVKPAPGGWERPTRGPGVNVLGEVKGTAPGRYLVVSAHYDHLGVIDGAIMNGADDNAAAVGSVVAVACALAGEAARPVTLIVALWDAEEPPYFLTSAMGSRSWVEDPHVPLAEVEAAIVLDLVGGGLWPGSPVHVALGAETSPELAAAVEATPVPDGLVVGQAGLALVERLVTGGRQPWSDYHDFREREVPVLFLSNGQTVHYHTAGDDFATLDLDKLDRQTTWLAALTRRLLSAPSRARWAPFERPEVDRAAARRLVEGALASGRFEEAAAVMRADLAGLAVGDDERARRVAVQRVQCLAGGHYPIAMCLGLGGER